MKWLLSALILILNLEIVAQTTVISKVNPASVPNFTDVQEKMRNRNYIEKSQFVKIDINRLQTEPIISIEIFEAIITLKRDKIEERETNNFTWFGNSEDKKVSAVFTVLKNDIQGQILTPTGLYAIETFENTSVIEKINQQKLPEEDCFSLDNYSGEHKTEGEQSGENSKERELINKDCKLRVLVMYTPDAEASSGANMYGHSQLCVDVMNQALANSDIGREAELVFVGRADFTETGDMKNDLILFKNDNDGVMDNVHNLRIQYAADVCVLIVNENHYTLCGKAAALRSSSEYAFALVGWGCSVNKYTFPHEIAHLFGCQHAISNGTDPNLDADAPHAHGYINSSNWHTIMASNNNTTRIPYWSNPNVNYGGQPTGTPAAHNAQMMEDNFERMMYLSPTGQQVTVTNSDVNIAWTKTIYSGGEMYTSGNVFIQWGRNYTFRAEESILLNAGFEVDGEATFEAMVLRCGERGSGELNYSAQDDISYKAFNTVNSESQSTLPDVTLYPNPVASTINLTEIDAKYSLLNVVIRTLDGKELLSLDNLEVHNGSIENKIFVDHLPKGLYFIQISSENHKTRILKFVKE